MLGRQWDRRKPGNKINKLGSAGKAGEGASEGGQRQMLTLSCF